MKYFLIAGEASGDLHGSRIMKSILKQDAAAQFRFWGGDQMNAVAPGLITHYKANAIMGFVEVLMSLKKVLNNLSHCKSEILKFQPDVVIFIDYPGFNLRMTEFAKKNGFKTVYFIAPKVWAWKENRAKKLEKYVDLLLIIFPFEIEYFKKWKVNTKYIGNPLLDEVADFRAANPYQKGDEKPILALLPGSRRQEIKLMLPIMLQTAAKLNQFRVLICGAPGLEYKDYEPYLKEDVNLEFGKTYSILAISEAAIVCSGTASLETALLNVPQVCAYKASPISIAIGRLLVKAKYMSLVNLNLGRLAVPELLQEVFTEERILSELTAVLPGGKDHEKLMKDYAELRLLFGEHGADTRAAKEIIQLIS
jgi:lipid-A-disaccharide synthase